MSQCVGSHFDPLLLYCTFWCSDMYSLRLGPINEISLANGHSSTSKGSIVSSGLLSYIWFQMVSINLWLYLGGHRG